MRRLALVMLAAAVGLAMAPVTARAGEDVQAQLEAMQQRMNHMEQQLQATTDQLHQANQKITSQQDLIQRAAIDQATKSGLSSFLDTLEVDGWLSAGWWYRFPNPDNGLLAGANHGFGGYTQPLHPDANSFSLDQAWIGLGRKASDENRAGFRLDMVMGKTAQILNAGGFLTGLGVVTGGLTTFPGEPSGSLAQFYLQQAYIDYLAPVGDQGILVQAGKMETWLGEERVEATQNWNITRGIVWALFDPITNVGIRASTAFGGGFSGGVGFVNGTRTPTDVDFNSDKAVVGKLEYEGDTFGAKFAATYGQSTDTQQSALFQLLSGLPQVQASKTETILELLLSWNPTEKISTYLDTNWMNSQNNQAAGLGPFPGVLPDNLHGFGVSAAGRYAFTDRVGLALRAEWVDLARRRLQDLRQYSITSTLDYKLTDHLTVKAEARYDDAGGMVHLNNADSFISGVGNFNREDQVTTGVEVLYTF